MMLATPLPPFPPFSPFHELSRQWLGGQRQRGMMAALGTERAWRAVRGRAPRSRESVVEAGGVQGRTLCSYICVCSSSVALGYFGLHGGTRWFLGQ